MFLLVSSSIRSKQLLCFVQGQCQKREQTRTTKNFVEFYNHSTLLTTGMFILNTISSLLERISPPPLPPPKKGNLVGLLQLSTYTTTILARVGVVFMGKWGML